MSQETLYLKIARNSVVHEPVVHLQDISSMECTREDIVRKLKQKEVYRFRTPSGGKKNHTRQEAFTTLKVIQLIHEEYPNVDIVNEGEKDFIIEYEPNPKENMFLQAVKVTVLCIILFFGSAFTIMAFNNDIGITELFGKLYYRIMGTEASGISGLEVGYAIGMAISILVFFNHIGKKKITPDPTPIQVEMRKYEQDVDTSFIENAGRKGHEIDVD